VKSSCFSPTGPICAGPPGLRDNEWAGRQPRPDGRGYFLSALRACCLLAWKRRGLVSFWLVLAALAGCTEHAADSPGGAPAGKAMTAAAGDLRLALESLRKLAEGSDAQPAQRTIYYLNQWLSSDPAAASAWQPDRMLDSLRRALRNTEGLERLDRLQFSLSSSAPWLDDISYLQQNLWLNDIARRAIREPTPARMQPWLKQIEATIGLPEAEQLAKAERLLDWVARNVQLDALPAMPKEPLASAGQGEAALPAERGEAGPGYGHLPLEILLYGHGDALERARIFILLCRQVGIDAVMLGFAEEQSATRRGWAPAALVGGKLYLFETALGLPVPAAEGNGIATLDEILKEPKLLDQLNVEGLPAYPVSAKDLKQGAIAMIDAEPAALSRRMQLLQAAMPAATRLALTTQPSQIDAALRKAKASSVTLWHAPLEAILYRIGLSRRASQDQKLALALHRLNVRFAPSRPLVKARNFHLQGRFENEDTKPAARSLYLQCRPPDREIDALMTNEFYRKSIGLEQTLPEDPAQRQVMLDMFTGIAREGKFDATYWLALTYFDSKPEETIRWLVKPVIEVSPPSPWTPGARYNLGRCYEQLGQLDLARQWLESDKDSPQRAGNLLRAKLMAGEQRAGSAAGDTEKK
jgi:hypothetical protein